jgi:hypothetical protein
MKRSLKWWVKCVVHNCVAHPLMVPAEVLDRVGLPEVADILYKFHDNTIPGDDPRNVVRML